MTAACVTIPLGPACVNLDGIRAGDRNLVTITLTNAGTPMDLTGLEVTAQARKSPTDGVSIDAVIEVTDPTAGVLTMRWPGEDVTTLMGGKPTFKGVWDLQVGSPPDDPVTVVAGAFLAVMDVTRS